MAGFFNDRFWPKADIGGVSKGGAVNLGGAKMKNILTVLLAVTAFALLVFAAKTYSDVGEPPDLLSVECVATSERALIRMQRNIRDDDATGLEYNVGIFRPHNENTDGPAPMCPTGSTAFSCLGAPHKEPHPDPCVPPLCT